MLNETTRPREGADRKTAKRLVAETPHEHEPDATVRRTRAQRVTSLFGEGPATATLDAPILKRDATTLHSPGGEGQGEGGIWSLQPLAFRHQSLPRCLVCGVVIPPTSVTCDTCPNPSAVMKEQALTTPDTATAGGTFVSQENSYD